MVRTIISPQFKAGKGSGLFRHPLLRVGAVVSVVLIVTVLVASSTLAARRSAASAPAVQFFEGVKSCSNSLPPQLVCTIMESNVPLLTGAKIAYISDPGFFSDPPTAPFFSTATGGSSDGRIDSDVVLTTAVLTGGEPSKAYGHCTFYNPTGTALCVFTHGTNSLSGFNATLVIGTLPDGNNSVIGKYWFDG